jgi:hypothetical protein
MKLITEKHESRGEANPRTARLIQQRAYELYIERGRETGHELEDLLKAEREIRERMERQRPA